MCARYAVSCGVADKWNVFLNRARPTEPIYRDSERAFAQLAAAATGLNRVEVMRAVDGQRRPDLEESGGKSASVDRSEA